MLYYLFTYLHSLDIPGTGMFQYISFRSAMAFITALVLATVYGKKVIRLLQKKQIGETIRNLDLEGQYRKQGTPTMGGIIIIASIVIPVLLFTKLHNVYIILMLITAIFLGFIGFLDDYIKVFRKNKDGLSGRFKIIGQVSLGLIVGVTLYMSNTAEIKVKTSTPVQIQTDEHGNKVSAFDQAITNSTKTTIPFVKNNEFDYAQLISWAGPDFLWLRWVVFVLVTIFIVTAVSNGANITDGLDGLATGTSAIIGVTLGILAYVSGNVIYADYLNIMYIPGTGELVVFMSAFIGAAIGFLWYNAFPAQIFMGDTGSLALGGIIAVFAILIRKELLIPIFGGIFLVENISVMMQVSYFKYTKRKFGEGRRIFKMAPLHHHYQKLGYTEPKIVTRFWIVGILLAVITIVTLKIR